MIDITNIPAEIVALPWWCPWRREPRFAGEAPTKIPYQTNHHRAKSNDPSTWATFAAAKAALERSHGRYEGIGFMLGEPYIGVDLDDCRNPDTGIIHPRALRIIASMNTFSEISPGLGGAKMIGRGAMPTPDGTGKNYRKDPWGTGEGGIEFYQRGRFFTVTGRRLNGTPLAINDITAPLARLYHELYPAPPPRLRTVGAVPDVDQAKRIARCAAYLDKIPASISGQGGHDRLLHAACLCLRFGIEDGNALDLLHHYNLRADPPWSDRDIERKLAEAHKLIGNEFGCMLVGSGDGRRPENARARRIVLIGDGE